MARPFRCRCVRCMPGTNYFKPRGVPLTTLEEVNLTVDEFEAIRLADLEGLYQEESAREMEISRQTFANIVNSAHKKIAEAIVKVKAIKIEGGVYKMAEMRKFRCYDCKHEWDVPYGTGRPQKCPQCESKNIHRSQEDRGCARSGRGRGRCGRPW